MATSAVTIRNELRPGDIGSIVLLHGRLYAREYGFDETFEAYVAGPLSEFVLSRDPGSRIWLAERDGVLVGCIAIVAVSAKEAQLRWFVVVPEARGVGLGKQLLDEAICFSRECGYDSVMLWTVSALAVAARLYRAAGFVKVEEHPVHRWGVDVVEEKYSMAISTA